MGTRWDTSGAGTPTGLWVTRLELVAAWELVRSATPQPVDLVGYDPFGADGA